MLAQREWGPGMCEGLSGGTSRWGGQSEDPASAAQTQEHRSAEGCAILVGHSEQQQQQQLAYVRQLATQTDLVQFQKQELGVLTAQLHKKQVVMEREQGMSMQRVADAEARSLKRVLEETNKSSIVLLQQRQELEVNIPQFVTRAPESERTHQPPQTLYAGKQRTAYYA
jgi:hypothetical protein